MITDRDEKFRGTSAARVRAQRSGERAFDCPADVQPSSQRPVGKSQASAPLGDSHSLTAVFEKSVASGVGGLNQLWSPHAIRRRITGVVVDAFKRVSGGAWTHIGKEFLEIIVPSIAHLNPARAIVLKRLVLLVVATSPHVQPSDVFAAIVGGASAARCKARTATTLQLPSLQLCASAGRADLAAVASIGPAAKGRTRNYELSEALSAQISATFSKSIHPQILPLN